jgi:hypothetical protein
MTNMLDHDLWTGKRTLQQDGIDQDDNDDDQKLYLVLNVIRRDKSVIEYKGNSI